MRDFRVTVVAATVLFLVIFSPRYSPAQDTSTPTPAAAKVSLSAEGTVTNAEGSPVKNAKVTITSGHIVREAVSNKDGKFSIKDLSPGTADIVYEAPGYDRLQEDGLPLVKGMDLSKTLQEKTAASKWALLLFIPGVVGLLWCTGCDVLNNQIRRKQNPEVKGDMSALPVGTDPGNASNTKLDNHFLTAAVGGVTWSATLCALVRFGGLGVGGVNSLYLFHWSLPMEIYVPAFGLVGALLFVLDIRRRYGRGKPTSTPEEEIPKGKEFGMRIFMGPYVAIVVVALFGEDIGLANFTSPAAKASLAFFSGLLVVMYLQALVEIGQERLGKRRTKSRANTPEGKKEELKEVMGNLVWGRLQKVGVNTVSEFAHLGNSALEKLAAEEPPLLKENLVALRDKAKEVAIPS